MQNLLSASYTNYFNVSEKRGIELTIALILVGLILITGLILYFKKPNYMKKYISYSIIILTLFAISIFLANIIIDAKDGAYKLENIDVRMKTDYFSIAIISTIFLSLILFSTPFFMDKENSIKSIDTKSLAYAGICIALSFGLSYIRLFKGPYGGSITIASLLPLAIYSYMYGTKKGLIAGVIVGLLQFIQDPYFYHTLQFLLDYIIAFGFVGMCGGLFKKYFKAHYAISLGLLVGIFFRFISHFISGAVFFGIWAPENFKNIWIYSFVYNISYVLPDGAICIVLGFILFKNKIFASQVLSKNANNKNLKDALLTEENI